jgi:argininosuccinate lyase
MALWGGRFNGDSSKELTNFSESVSFDKRLYKYDIAGSKAHSAMLAAAGIIPQQTAALIATELSAIQAKIDTGDFAFKAELEDIHMHIEQALIDKLGNEGARVHTARSRNDQVALDIRMYLMDENQTIVAMLQDMQRALVGQADANDRVIMPGFTHMQHAQPVLFAHHLLAYVEMFQRDIERLKDSYIRLNVMPLGSGALAGTTLPIDRDMVCRELGFAKISANSMDAVADRDFALELLSALAIISMHISRLSEDLILWCSQEFNFIELADAFCTGSSLMPQKKNPDIAELSRGKTGRVYGALMSLLTTCKGLPLTYNRDMQEDKEQIFDAVDTVKKILRIYPAMIATMTINAEKMLQMASDPALMATDLAEMLVEQGVPFRSAHHQIGAFVKWCRDNGKLLNQASLDEMKLTIPSATTEFTSAFSPAISVAKREVPGGTGFMSVRTNIDKWLVSLG